MLHEKLFTEGGMESSIPPFGDYRLIILMIVWIIIQAVLIICNIRSNFFIQHTSLLYLLQLICMSGKKIKNKVSRN